MVMGMDELTLTYNAEKVELTISPIWGSRLHNITEVVRCKDCFYNDKICPASFSDREDEDYCSIGRRDDPWAKKN